MNEWQPIETAPEGIDVLVIRRDLVIHVAKISGIRNKFGVMSADFGNASRSFFFPVSGNYDSDDTPTHWMPLPKPPITNT